MISPIRHCSLLFVALTCTSAFTITLHSSSSSTSTSRTTTRLASSSPWEGPSSLSSLILKDELLSLIPSRPFGAPATNLTTPDELVARIRHAAACLEPLTPLPPLARSATALSTLSGDWRLVYSDAGEITRLVTLPLGFRLGPVFQCLDAADGRFENQALVKHATRLVSGHTRVSADFWLATPLGTTNRAGVVNVGERANVRFNRVAFTLRRFLLFPTFGRIRKTARPNGPSEQQGVVPCLDITYLDDTLRISRGGDGSLFVLVRVDPTQRRQQAMPMLSLDEGTTKDIDDTAPTYDASVDILPSGSRD